MHKPNHQRLSAIADVISRNPGIGVTDIRKRLGLSWDDVWHSLPTMERQGILLSEDHNGGLYVFKIMTEGRK